jgi:integrase/recombinase XerD
MKVQRARLPETNRSTWLVLDDDYLPIQAISAFLKFCENLGRSPYTVRAWAHHLKLFWEFLHDEQIEWTNMNVAHLANFVSWLRRPQTDVVSIAHQGAKRTDATIDQILAAVHSFYDFHMRMKHVPDLELYQFLTLPNRQYKSFLHGIAKSKPVQTRVVKVKHEKRLIKTLSRDDVQQLLNVCTHCRDTFLLTLLYSTGLRIGQALGLRHGDICIEAGELRIVPREENVNGARAKTRDPYTIPVPPEVLQLYTTYLIEDLDAMNVDALPDYVFVNLWQGEPGHPMTYEAVMSLIRRLRKKTGIQVTPHMLRHTCATQWIRDDRLPLPTVSRLLGHVNIQTTHAIYVHLTPQDLRQELQEAKKNAGVADGC